jgi:hypothetical protein
MISFLYIKTLKCLLFIYLAQNRLDINNYSHLSNKCDVTFTDFRNSTLHKIKIHYAHLLIFVTNFQYSYRTFSIITKPNDDFSHGHLEP